MLVVVSRKRFERNDKPAKTHSFDTGAAWENLALQGTAQGLVVHAMSGFDYENARKELRIPEQYQVECMIAIGRRAKKDNLPGDLQEMEFPKGRKDLKDIILEGPFEG